MSASAGDDTASARQTSSTIDATDARLLLLHAAMAEKTQPKPARVPRRVQATRFVALVSLGQCVGVEKIVVGMPIHDSVYQWARAERRPRRFWLALMEL